MTDQFVVALKIIFQDMLIKQHSFKLRMGYNPAKYSFVKQKNKQNLYNDYLIMIKKGENQEKICFRGSRPGMTYWPDQLQSLVRV